MARNGDVANKIGTYLKALAAKDNGVPFYVALPSSTIDWTVRVRRSDSDRGERRKTRSDPDLRDVFPTALSRASKLFRRVGRGKSCL